MKFEKTQKKQLLITGILLIIGIIGLIIFMNSLKSEACRINEDMNHRNANLTYPVQMDFGFNRIKIGCDRTEIGDGNFDYFGINEFLIGGVMLFGLGMVWFMFKDKTSQKDDKTNQKEVSK